MYTGIYKIYKYTTTTTTTTTITTSDEKWNFQDSVFHADFPYEKEDKMGIPALKYRFSVCRLVLSIMEPELRG
jgi:hypothetical protein